VSIGLATFSVGEEEHLGIPVVAARRWWWDTQHDYCEKEEQWNKRRERHAEQIVW